MTIIITIGNLEQDIHTAWWNWGIRKGASFRRQFSFCNQREDWLIESLTLKSLTQHISYLNTFLRVFPRSVGVWEWKISAKHAQVLLPSSIFVTRETIERRTSMQMCFSTKNKIYVRCTYTLRCLRWFVQRKKWENRLDKGKRNACRCFYNCNCIPQSERRAMTKGEDQQMLVVYALASILMKEKGKECKGHDSCIFHFHIGFFRRVVVDRWFRSYPVVSLPSVTSGLNDTRKPHSLAEEGEFVSHRFFSLSLRNVCLCVWCRAFFILCPLYGTVRDKWNSSSSFVTFLSDGLFLPLRSHWSLMNTKGMKQKQQ